MRFFETIHGIFLDDLDAIGVLHNSRHLMFFERAQGAFWRHLGWRRIVDYESNPDGLQVVRENRVEYLRPVESADDVRVRTWVERLGRTSLVFRFRMLPMDHELPFSEGKKVMVKIDPRTRRPDAWTDEFRGMITPWEEPAAEEASTDRSSSMSSPDGTRTEESDIIERPSGSAPCPTIS